MEENTSIGYVLNSHHLTLGYPPKGLFQGRMCNSPPGGETVVLIQLLGGPAAAAEKLNVPMDYLGQIAIPLLNDRVVRLDNKPDIRRLDIVGPVAAFCSK
jgi:hypothetical protein